MSASHRPYRQVARAAATAETQRRIIAAFLTFLRERWLDAITLDDVAAAAGTTRQTVIRLFGGKEGLLSAVAEQMKQEIVARRAMPAGSSPATVARVLAQDYEIAGDLTVRMLDQEGRHPALTPLLNNGRRGHRAWLANVFAPALARLPDAPRDACLTRLVVVTDVYAWKLLRRDQGRDIEEVEALIATMIGKMLTEDVP